MVDKNTEKTPPDVAHAIASAPLPTVHIVGGYSWGGHAVYKDALTRHRTGDWDIDTGFYEPLEEN